MALDFSSSSGCRDSLVPSGRVYGVLPKVISPYLRGKRLSSSLQAILTKRRTGRWNHPRPKPRLITSTPLHYAIVERASLDLTVAKEKPSSYASIEK